ncbi:MBL fold metallo-hydrolase [Nonomuraea fuscirosea]|uniref:MBL fold metallo-hydrolase n=1 Tax=Nonomuraea fuscirosea TaxID=1291556 RepID=UPI0033D207CC
MAVAGCCARHPSTPITAAGLPAALRLIYTHHHWDHVWGSCAWPEAEIIGHRAGTRLLEAKAQRPWSHHYLRAEADPMLGPSFRARAWAMPSWEGFSMMPPHTEFDEGLTLSGGIEVRHVGGLHAEDSTVVAVPNSGVLLLGDCFYAPPLHLRKAGDGYVADLVDWLLSEYPQGRYDWFVDGHSAPRSRQSLRDPTVSGVGWSDQSQSLTFTSRGSGAPCPVSMSCLRLIR